MPTCPRAARVGLVLIAAASLLSSCQPEDPELGNAPCPPPGGLMPERCQPSESSIADRLAAERGFIVLVALDRTGNNERPFALSRARQIVSDSNIIGVLANDLNNLLDIPDRIIVSLRSCGVDQNGNVVADAYYDPSTGSITICDGFFYGVERALGHLPDDQFAQSVIYVVGFTFLHEAGHALFDKLQLLISGREEDVADQFGAFMLAGNPAAQQIALAGAEWFRGTFMENPNQLPFSWDTHSLDPQRFYNINCWVFGSDPERYAYLVADGTVPTDRAVYCPGEWNQFARTLSALLAPYSRQ